MPENHLKEIEHKPSPVLYETLLSNGTTIYVMPHGKAVDCNGATYNAVFTVTDNGDIEDVDYWIKDE